VLAGDMIQTEMECTSNEARNPSMAGRFTLVHNPCSTMLDASEYAQKVNVT
jgi:hypothetical protein